MPFLPSSPSATNQLKRKKPFKDSIPPCPPEISFAKPSAASGNSTPTQPPVGHLFHKRFDFASCFVKVFVPNER